MTELQELGRTYEKGIEFYDQGLLIDALAEFEKVFKDASPNSPEARLAKFYIGETHARLAEEDVKRGAVERAEVHLKEAIKRNPKYPDLHFQLAEIVAESGAIHQAILELETALELNPDYAKALLFLGILIYEIGDYTDGAHHVSHAASLEPRYNTPVYRGAIAAHEKGEHRKALARFQELATTNVDDISFHFGVGKKLYRSGDYAGAAESFEQALSLQSSYPDIRNWLGLALLATKENERAFEQFQVALEINPNFAAAAINAGVACEMMGIPGDAADFYARALETDPENPEARERLARLRR